jgi:inorganic pyrophosphatase
MSKVNATHYEDIPTFPARRKKSERCVHAIIETPQGCKHKYALNSDFGIIAFHDVLPDDLEWPVDYGFIPRTLAPDGDPLDIVVLTDGGLFSGCFIVVRILGAIRETKDGIENARLIAVPLPSPGAPQATDTYRELTDLPSARLGTIVNFLRGYSERQGHEIVVQSMADAGRAMRLIAQAIKAFKKSRA